MANIRISDLGNIDGLDGLGSMYHSTQYWNNFDHSKKKLEIDLDSVYYNLDEILQHITEDIKVTDKFGGRIMDAAYSLYDKVRKQNEGTHISDHHSTLQAMGAIINRAVGYHYVMSILMKYMKNKDLDSREWTVICGFLYNDEKKPYKWDDEEGVYKVK